MLDYLFDQQRTNSSVAHVSNHCEVIRTDLA
jgi:hypothetical protein